MGRTLQGGALNLDVDSNGLGDAKLTTSVLAHHFGFMGGGSPAFLGVADESDGSMRQYRTQHRVDFAGKLRKLSCRVTFNERTTVTTLFIQLDGTSAEHKVEIPAGEVGVFASTEADVDFVSGQMIGGYCSSPASASTPDIAIAAVWAEMETEDGHHTCFSARGVPLVMNGSGLTETPYAAIPLMGHVGGYMQSRGWVQGDEYVSQSVAVSDLALTTRVAGTLTELQATMLDGTLDVGLTITVVVNGSPTDLELIVLAGNTRGFYSQGPGHSVDIAEDDEVAFLITADGSPSSGTATVLMIGCNFAAADDVQFSEMMAAGDTGVSSRVGTSLAPDDFEWDRGEEFAIAFGNPRQYSNFSTILSWNTAAVPPFTIPPVAQPFPFGCILSNMRINCAVWDPDNTADLTVRMYVNGVPGNSAVSILGLGVHEDDEHSDIIVAGRMVLFEAAYEGPKGSYAIAARLSTATVRVQDADDDGGGPVTGPRLLPEPDPITPEPCVTHRVRCWLITRRDGQRFAYTEHDENVEYDEVLYRACGSLVGSASELGAVMGEVGNQELTGYLSELGISAIDVLGGRFSGASIEVWLIPYGDFIDNEEPVQIATGLVGAVRNGDAKFTLEALSPSAQLAQKVITKVITKTCRHRLGDDKCGVDLTSMIVTGSVTDLAEADSYPINAKRRFVDSSRFEDDGWFEAGTITWISGLNAGQSTDIKNFADGAFVLWDTMLYEIAEGDEYEATPGCDREFTTCKNKFGNYLNFGGFKDLPGPDAVANTPNWKV